jgi:hypothetical protein
MRLLPPYPCLYNIPLSSPKTKHNDVAEENAITFHLLPPSSFPILIFITFRLARRNKAEPKLGVHVQRHSRRELDYPPNFFFLILIPIIALSKRRRFLLILPIHIPVIFI